MRLTILILALVPLAAMALPAAAQNMFAPRVTVNDQVITDYEVRQRARFLEVLNTAGNLEQEAIDGLIDDRLRIEEAGRLGISLDEGAIRQGMEEFAGRADLGADEFIAAIGEAGVAEETFRDFVRGGLVWREVVRARFARRIDVTDAEIDRAMSLGAQPATMQVLISEIFLPTAPEFAEQTAELAPQIAALSSVSEFSEAARRFSAAGSSEDGGRLDWMPLSDLPGRIGGQIMALSPGEVTDPIELENALALFQLRDRRAQRSSADSEVTVRYKRLLIPGGQSEAARARAARIRAATDTCTDLYATAGDLAQNRLFVEERTLSAVPSDIARELSRLNAQESSAALTAGDDLVLLMLCSRRPRSDEPASRNQVANRLIDRRLNALADGYLEQLRADAFIRIE